MASERSQAGFGDLRLRILSGATMAVLVLWLFYLGGWWSAALIAVLGGACAYEWRAMTCARGGACGMRASVAVIGIGCAVIGAYAIGWAGGAPWLWGGVMTGLGLILGTIAICLAQDRGRTPAPVWTIMGLGYIGLAALGILCLRFVGMHGFLGVLWVALVVVAADVGGYFAGRILGGPRLWPRVSPKKTWSGLLGGIGLAFIAGGVFSWATTGTYFYQVCTVSAFAALVAQGGDLAGSAAKRYFGVKDSSALIPGHGGVLDRVDGHMAAALVASAITLCRDGQAIFIW